MSRTAQQIADESQDLTRFQLCQRLAQAEEDRDEYSRSMMADERRANKAEAYAEEITSQARNVVYFWRRLYSHIEGVKGSLLETSVDQLERVLNRENEIGTGTNQRQGADSPASATTDPSGEQDKARDAVTTAAPPLNAPLATPGAQSAPATTSNGWHRIATVEGAVLWKCPRCKRETWADEKAPPACGCLAVCPSCDGSGMDEGLRDGRTPCPDCMGRSGWKSCGPDFWQAAEVYADEWEKAPDKHLMFHHIGRAFLAEAFWHENVAEKRLVKERIEFWARIDDLRKQVENRKARLRAANPVLSQVHSQAEQWRQCNRCAWAFDATKHDGMLWCPECESHDTRSVSAPKLRGHAQCNQQVKP